MSLFLATNQEISYEQLLHNCLLLHVSCYRRWGPAGDRTLLLEAAVFVVFSAVVEPSRTPYSPPNCLSNFPSRRPKLQGNRKPINQVIANNRELPQLLIKLDLLSNLQTLNAIENVTL